MLGCPFSVQVASGPDVTREKVREIQRPLYITGKPGIVYIAGTVGVGLMAGPLLSQIGVNGPHNGMPSHNGRDPTAVHEVSSRF